jgi:transposase
MQVVHERCAGVDVHKRTVVVTVLVSPVQSAPPKAGKAAVEKYTRTFGTMTADLLGLSEWLEKLGVTQVAMESTGVYWWPVYNLLEAGRTILLVNPRHIKAVPGRKTDVKDSEWLADLLRHGLLRASFIPPQPIRALRELTRYRKTLVRERTAQINRLQKVLEAANIKLAAVATNVLGKSPRAMLEALIAGEEDVAVLAEQARGRLRAKIPDLKRALHGHLQPQHRFLLRAILAHIDFLDAAIATTEAEIAQHLAASQDTQDAMRLLQTIPGIHETAASAILAEIGTDMSCFPSAKHLASWVGLCPGNKQSGGKRLSAGITAGNPWLRGILGEVVWAITHTRDNYWVAQYRRLAKRRGLHKAVVAVAHSLLTIIYHMLRDRRPYADLGADYFDRINTARLERHHVRRLEQLGYTVTLTPTQVA